MRCPRQYCAAMKVLKATLALLGIAGIVATLVLLGKFWLDSKTLLGAAQRYDAGSAYLDPMVAASIIVGVTALSFFLLGLAVGLPLRTAGRIQKEALQQASASRQADTAAGQAGSDAQA